MQLCPERNYTRSGTILINCNKCTLLQFFFEARDGVQDQITNRFRYNILRAYLKHTGASPAGGGKKGSEVKIVCKNGVAVLPCIGHNDAVFGGTLTDI